MRSLRVAARGVAAAGSAARRQCTAALALAAQPHVGRPAPRVAAAPSGRAPPRGGGKTIPFKLADIGEGIAEVEVLAWFVAAGDE